MEIIKEASSFRDPSGHVFYYGNELYRNISPVYAKNYDLFIQSGLYKELVRDKLIIPHTEVKLDKDFQEPVYLTIKPEKVDFISYPYEWSFSQLKEAALLTLELVKRGLEKGMILKDASAYNIQFHQGNPVLIDTLSFEEYKDGMVWIAYSQFCEHFLAPLALMAYKDPRLGQLSRIHLDGIPLDLAASLLPKRLKFRFGLSVHIFLLAKEQKKLADSKIEVTRYIMSKFRLLSLIDSLESSVRSIRLKTTAPKCSDYYQTSDYSEKAMASKVDFVEQALVQYKPDVVWDIGGNTWEFSRLASCRGINTICFDNDLQVVDLNYQAVKRNKDKHLLPLFLDIANPTPDIGWELTERKSIFNRVNAGMVLALALIHHLRITYDIPLENIAHLFSRLAPRLCIEFIPKTDSQVRRLLKDREDIFSDYEQAGFETAFRKYFKIDNTFSIIDSERTIYTMTRT